MTRGGRVPIVKIKCPTTGKDVDTGIAMDLGSFATATFKANAVKCPHCGQTHVWSKQDAFVE